MLNDEPIRANCLTDNELPKHTKLTTEAERPMLAIDLTEHVDPKLEKFSTLIGVPSLVLPYAATEHPEPNLV
jgi:hypothetical protein